MKTDTTTLAPTDAELVAFAVADEFLLFCDEDDFVQIARAVLAKWGAPAPASGEARMPLSDEQIDVMRFTWTNLPQAPTGRDDFVNIVRLIEKHHGIGITAAQKEAPCAPTP